MATRRVHRDERRSSAAWQLRPEVVPALLTQLLAQLGTILLGQLACSLGALAGLLGLQGSPEIRLATLGVIARHGTYRRHGSVAPHCITLRRSL